MTEPSQGPARARRVQPTELRNIGLFGALPESVLEHLSSTLEVIDVPPGTYLFREDDAADCMFVVLQGDMEITKRSKSGSEARVAVLGPRDWFGEMSIVDVQPRSASVLTVSPARLVRMTSADLDRLYRFDVKAYALIILNIAREMSRRLRVADGMVADLVANMEGWVKKKVD